MRLTIRFRSTDPVTIPHVQAVKVVGPDTLETQTFGNGPITHRGVAAFEVAPFVFPSQEPEGLDDGTQNPERGIAPDTAEPISEVDRRCETCGNTWHSDEVPVSHCLNCGSLRVAIV